MNENLMVYTDAPVVDHAVRKYRGDVATGYDTKRQNSPKWMAEDRIIKEMLCSVKSGAKVLDCPVGTGRFIPHYEARNFRVLGLDVSEDMLCEASGKITNSSLVRLDVGDIRDLRLPANSVDVSLMIRLTRWLLPDDCISALHNLQRVTKDRIIFTARVRNHAHARSYDLIEFALDGWEITKDEPAGEEDYRVIQLRRVAA